jgi:hypothetical protein
MNFGKRSDRTRLQAAVALAIVTTLFIHPEKGNSDFGKIRDLHKLLRLLDGEMLWLGCIMMPMQI